MYVYIESEHNLWTVGFYSPDGKWHPDSDHDNREDARARVHYLNESYAVRAFHVWGVVPLWNPMYV